MTILSWCFTLNKSKSFISYLYRLQGTSNTNNRQSVNNTFLHFNKQTINIIQKKPFYLLSYFPLGFLPAKTFWLKATLTVSLPKDV